MKNILILALDKIGSMRTILYIILPVLLFTNASAQQARVGCVDKSMRVQAEQMKHDFKAQGMEVYKDAMLSMKPGQPYPIAVQLTEKELYQFILVGDGDAGKIYFELFDGKDHKLAEKVIKKGDGTNFIIYSFMPQKSDIYLVVLTQKVKGNADVCGSFTIMQKASANGTGQ